NETIACNGIAAVTPAGGTPPYSYRWVSGGQRTDTIKGQCAGTYCCVITDSKGCKITTCVTINNATGIDNIDYSQVTTIFPNPNKGVFTIEVQGGRDNQYIEVYDMLGEKVYTSSLIPLQMGSSVQIDIGSKASGLYLYRVITETGSLVGEGKFILE
ncbi:MAG TPA: T9SS type A sorting domain-containing protein, partial [Bacteroidia bacterium]|nr:T9SS type A sorting domain-containing protein [Bacteroidia bacterium]